MMAVSPPPATILPSSVNSIPVKAPNDLGTNVHQNVWRQIIRDLEIAGPHLTPVPFIDKPHYFDLLSVFSEVEESFFDKLKSTITKSKRFKYVGSLKSMINFLTVNSDRMNDIIQLRDQTPVISSKFIEHALIGKQDNVECDYKLRIESPHVHAFHLNMDPKIAVGIDRAMPGLNSPTTLLIVAEVFSGSNVALLSQQGPKSEEGDNTIEFLHANDPIPLAFAALKINLENNGVFKSPPHVMSPSQLVGTKHWIFSESKHPEESPCIRTLTNGLLYSVNRGSGSYELISLTMGDAGSAPADSTPADSKSAGSKPAGSKPATSKPAASNSAGSKPAASNSAGSKHAGSTQTGSTHLCLKHAGALKAGSPRTAYLETCRSITKRISMSLGGAKQSDSKAANAKSNKSQYHHHHIC